jgi:hypothetical protein
MLDIQVLFGAGLNYLLGLQPPRSLYFFNCELKNWGNENINVFFVYQFCKLSVCLWLVAEQWLISPNTPVSSSNKSDRHNITEILLRVVLNTIN